MEMHQIRYFLAVARVLNFTHAAAECHVSQPALSRAIKQLEDELGGELFRRERSLSHLTELGRMMLPLLTQTYETANSAKTLATAFRHGHIAPLRIALSNSVDLKILIDPLSQLLETLPGVEMAFLRGDANTVATALKSGDFELMVAGTLPSNWDRFRVWPLFTSDFQLLLHRDHRLAALPSVPLAMLADERIIHRPYCELAGNLTDVLAENGIHAATRNAVASDHDLLALLESNVGVAIAPSILPRSAVLRAVRIEGLNMQCGVNLYAVIGRQYSPAAAALIQLLRTANWHDRLAAFETSEAIA